MREERGPIRALALIVAVLSMTLSGCSAGKLVLVAVAFQPGTVSGTASSVLHQCGQSSTVRRIETFKRVEGNIGAEIYTNADSVTDPAIKSVLSCLRRSSAVESVGTVFLV